MLRATRRASMTRAQLCTVVAATALDGFGPADPGWDAGWVVLDDMAMGMSAELKGHIVQADVVLASNEIFTDQMYIDSLDAETMREYRGTLTSPGRDSAFLPSLS